MRARRLLVVTAVLVLGLLACAVWVSIRRGDRDEPSVPVPRGDRENAVDASSTRSGDIAHADESPVPTGARMRVRVRDDAASAGVPVHFEARERHAGYYGPPGKALAVVPTGPREARVDGVESGKAYMVGALSLDGRWVSSGTYTRVDSDSEEDVTLTLVPAATIDGQVLGPNGTPIGGAEVRTFMSAVFPRPVRTDAQGRYVLRDVGAETALGAHAEGFAPDYEGPRIGLEGGARVYFELCPAWELVGSAFDGDGNPIRSRIAAWAQGEEEYVVPDAEGRFAFRSLPREGMDIVLEWAPAPHVSGRVRLPMKPPTLETRRDAGRIEIAPRYWQRLSVVDCAGSPLPGVTVRADEELRTTTDSRGQAGIWLPAGRHALDLDGLTVQQPVEAVVGNLETPPPLRLVARETYMLVGRVVCEGGNVARFSRFELVARDPDRPPEPSDPLVSLFDRGPLRPHLEDDGSFRCVVPRTLARVELTLREQLQGWIGNRMPQEFAREVIALPAARAELTIPAAVAVGFYLRPPSDPAALRLEQLTVESLTSTWARTHALQMLGDGRAVVFPMTPGTVTIRITASDGRFTVLPGVELGGARWPEFTPHLDK